MIRNSIGIVFFMLSGFFIYGLEIFAFISFPEPYPLGVRLTVFSCFCIPVVIFYVVGLLFYQRSNWKVALGTILISVNAFVLFSFMTLIAMLHSPNFLHQLGDSGHMDAFNNYVVGFGLMILLTVLGGACYWFGTSERSVD